jgi:hypothetical protein
LRAVRRDLQPLLRRFSDEPGIVRHVAILLDSSGWLAARLTRPARL